MSELNTNIVTLISDVPKVSDDGKSLRWRDVGYIAFAEYDRQANAAADKLRLIREEVSGITQDYAAMNQELLIEREARANAQNERDALVAAVLKCDDDKCTSGDWIALVLMARGMVGQK